MKTRLEIIVEKLEALSSDSTSQWFEHAKFRKEHKNELNESQIIALHLLQEIERTEIDKDAVRQMLGTDEETFGRILSGKYIYDSCDFKNKVISLKIPDKFDRFIVDFRKIMGDSYMCGNEYQSGSYSYNMIFPKLHKLLIKYEK